MKFWESILENLKLVRIWEDQFTFFNTQSLEEMGRMLKEKVENGFRDDEKGVDE